jgi:hypothetical protein
MFDGYWARDGESAGNASGGHITLWNGQRMSIAGVEGFISWLGRGIGIPSAHIPGTSIGYSDLQNSKVILFWAVQ